MQEISPSFFEMTVALAFDYFRKKEVDIAIIEVGLGGRLDSTNFITPELSVITNISLEHTAMLGNSISEIAFEKAGIIKEGIPVLIGEYHKESFPVFSKIASEKEASIFTTKRIIVNREQNQKSEPSCQPISIFYRNNQIGENIKCPLLGAYQMKNISTYTRAALYFCEKLDISTYYIVSGIEKVLQNVHLQGRWQILNDKPMTICDVAHNRACFEEIITQIEQLNYAHVHFIIGFVNDKDIDSIISILPKQHKTYYICQADIERALSITQLHELMEKAKLHTIIGGRVYDAYRLVLRNANPEDLIFISGSTFVVGELLKKL
jgi:dihydrofolate synthase/folylpolyglutamate synthase